MVDILSRRVFVCRSGVVMEALSNALYFKVPTRVYFYQWMHDPSMNYWYVFVGAAALYLSGIPLLVSFMRHRAPINPKTLLIVWNFLLCAFSFVGALIVVPFLLVQLREHGFQHVVCSEDWQFYPAVTITISLFIYSKIPELVDTVFLAIRKREIILLHWYHHATVLLFCWWGGFHNVGGTGLFFSGMNLTVHSVMYGYYFLSAVGIRPPFPMFITLIQIGQMIVGTYVVYACISCAKYPSFYISGLLMYVSYFCLFLMFFLNRYVFASKRTKEEDMRLSKDKIF